MKRIVAVAVIALFAGAAQAADRADRADRDVDLYVRLDSGWSFSRDVGKGMENGISNSPAVGVGFGVRGQFGAPGQSLRVDVTFGSMGDVSVATGMANVYFDVARVWRFAPYIGAGFGFSSNTVGDLVDTIADVFQGDDVESSFALQLSAGVGIDVTPNWVVDVGYRYMDVGESLIGEILFCGGTREYPGRVDYRAHKIQAGIRYQF